MDLPARTVDVTLLVAPLNTVDAVVSRLPVIGSVLGGSLVSIPVKVSGNWGDPKVTPLPPRNCADEGRSAMPAPDLTRPSKVSGCRAS